MDVENGLPGIGSGVKYQPVTTFIDPEFFSQQPGGVKQLAKDRRILGRHFVERAEMFFGDDQDMNRCDGVNILKSQDFFILVYLIGRDMALGNLTKNAVHYY